MFYNFSIYFRDEHVVYRRQTSVGMACRWCSADVSVSASRAIMLRGDLELTFLQARSMCVIENGDLAATDSTAIIDYIVNLVGEADNSAA